MIAAATVSELCDLFGLTPRAVRHYEQCGLIPAAARDRHGARRYDPSVRADLAMIVLLRRAGVPIDEIKQIQQLGQSAGQSTQRSHILEKLEERLRVAEAHREAVLEAIRSFGPARAARSTGR
jgi:DNA-binding transcriptional MerR regulator